MTQYHPRAWAACVALTLSIPPAQASQALIDVLVKKGYLTAEEAETVLNEAGATQAQSRGVFIPKSKLVEKVTVSGRLHAQYDNLSADVDHGSDPATENSFQLRRTLLGVKAELVDGWYGEIVADFSEDNNRLDKAYIGKKLGNHRIIAGYDKAPFGIEETRSSSKIKAVERSPLNRFFIEDMDWGSTVAGLQLHGEPAAGLGYALAVTNARQKNLKDGSDYSSDNTENSMAWWGRLGYQLQNDAFPLLIGADVGYIPEDGAIQYDDSLVKRDALMWDIYADLGMDRFSMLAHMMGADMDHAAANGNGEANSSNASPIGFNLQPAFFLTDKLEAVLSYSWIDSDGVGIDPSDVTRRVNDNSGLWDKYQSIYLGGNWYIRGNDLKLSAGYEYAEGRDILESKVHGSALAAEDNDISINGVRTRMQLMF
jgi:phosphate-selective porin